MTRTELLAATGNIWYVACYREGNRRRFQTAVYVRAASAERARAVGHRETPPRPCDLFVIERGPIKFWGGHFKNTPAGKIAAVGLLRRWGGF